MAEVASAALKEIHNVFQVCGIYELVARTWLIDIEVFNLIEHFGVMDRDTYMLEMANSLASRVVATCMNLVTVQIKGLQDLVWCIHDQQTHKQPLIAAEFVQFIKKEAMVGKQTENERAETDEKMSLLGKLIAE